jgi:hypothetical protein
MNLKHATLVSALLIFSLSAVPSESELVYKGTREFGLSGAAVSDSVDGSTFELDATIGQYVLDYWELGAVIGLGTSDSISQFRLGLFTEYNFELQTTVLPYTGLSVNFLAVDVDAREPGKPAGSETAASIGLELGLKSFLSENVAVFGAVFTEWATEDVFVSGNNVQDTNTGIRWGLRFFF